MYRNNTQLLLTDKMNFVLNHGALGDAITSLPAIIHARLMYQQGVEMRVWCGSWQMELFEHLLKPYGEFVIKNMETFPMEGFARKSDDAWGGGPVAINAPPFDTHTRNRVHMVDFAFNFLLDSQPEDMAQRSYPTRAPLGPRKIEGEYVVFPVGATSDNKLFKAKVMAPIMRWALDRGFSPVVVGTKTSHTKVNVGGKLEPIMMREQTDMLPKEVFERCIDLRNTTTLLELRDILGHAAAVVTVDGGTTHLAGTTDTNIIYAMGTTIPKHRYIARYGDANYKIRYVGPRDLECAGCQSHWTMMPGYDFRFCAYGDSECMNRLDPQDFIDGLKELGL